MLGPTKLPGPDSIDAVAVCDPASSVPLIALMVIVSTWLLPTGLVSVAGVIWMLALTQSFSASALLAPVPLVSRWSRTVLTVTSVSALTTVVPSAAELIWTVHEPVAATVVQVLPPTKLPGPLTRSRT